MSEIFRPADAFNQSLNGWDASTVTDMPEMFRSSSLSTANYNALLLSWSKLNDLQSNVRPGAENAL
ncbi:hypothetical protein MNBD_GAMMA10-2280 [hydrothermal vent metagenome]|uniref:Chitinase n=1 Tax=hydrothermal vent metagenome TaxID=652676 RepID=A0A3B0X950_9ZZZZ